MSNDIERDERLAASVLRLRSALSAALLALADIEAVESVEDARKIARQGRLDARAVLGGGGTQKERPPSGGMGSGPGLEGRT